MKILIFLFLCLLVGFIGYKRKIGLGWAFFFSAFFTPIVGLLLSLFSEPGKYAPIKQTNSTRIAKMVLIVASLFFFVMAFWYQSHDNDRISIMSTYEKYRSQLALFLAVGLLGSAAYVSGHNFTQRPISKNRTHEIDSH